MGASVYILTTEALMGFSALALKEDGLGSSLLILSSRFKGLEDTFNYYKTGMIRWSSPELQSMSESASSHEFIAEYLLGSNEEQERCFKTFAYRFKQYLQSLNFAAEAHYKKLGLSYRNLMSVDSLVNGVMNAMEINHFVPIGTYISKNKPSSVKDILQFGSFYVHCVLPQDTTWSTNVQVRVSLHVSNSRNMSRDDPAWAPADYELGDFFATDKDLKTGKRVETNYGIDIQSFSSWLRIKRLAYVRKRTNKVGSDQLDMALNQYLLSVKSLYKEMRGAIDLHRKALNLISICLYAFDALKKEKFPGDPIELPPVGGQGWPWTSGPAVVSVPGEDAPQAFLERLVAGDLDVFKSVDFGLESVAISLEKFGDLFLSYQTHLREILENLEIFSSDPDLHGFSVSSLVNSYLALFGYLSPVFPQIGAQVAIIRHAASRGLGGGDPKTTYRVLPSEEFWKDNILAEVDKGSPETLATPIPFIWAKFSEVTMPQLFELQKKSKTTA
jgi:hypothetical protein